MAAGPGLVRLKFSYFSKIGQFAVMKKNEDSSLGRKLLVPIGIILNRTWVSLFIHLDI